MNFYTVTSLDGTSTISACHLEDAINTFARVHLSMTNAVCWASKSANKDPAIFDGAVEVALIDGDGDLEELIDGATGCLSRARSIWIFEPQKRYRQILSSLKVNGDGEIEAALKEIAVLAPMIEGLSVAAIVSQVNEVLPPDRKCSVSF